MQAAGHQNVGLCWNSNPTDVVNGSVKQSFDLLRPWIRNCAHQRADERLSVARTVHTAEQNGLRPLHALRSRGEQGARAISSLLQSSVDGALPRMMRFVALLRLRYLFAAARRSHAGEPFRSSDGRRPEAAGLGQGGLLLPELSRSRATGSAWQELGKTTEGRPYIAATIAAPETLRQLDHYREIQARLADPRKTIAGRGREADRRRQDRRA